MLSATGAVVIVAINAHFVAIWRSAGRRAPNIA